MPSSHLILCHPLLLLPLILPSIRVFSNESTLHMRWPKYLSFSFSIIPSNEHPGLISFRLEWLDLLAIFWVLIAACRLSLVAVREGYSSVWYMGFSLRWLLSLWSTRSRAQVQ